MSTPTSETGIQWIHEYCQGSSYATALRWQLKSYHALHQLRCPGTSFLAFADRTEPIAHWIDLVGSRLSPTTARCHLGRVKGFTAWLFREGRLSDDVFFYVSVPAALQGALPTLRLWRNLQRAIADFSNQLPTVAHTSLQIAHRWNLYLNRSESQGFAEDSQDLVFGFLQQVSLEAPSMGRALAWLRGLELFFEFRTQQGALRANPLPSWIQRYRSRSALFRALASSSIEALSAAQRQPFFQSDLAPWLQEYLQHQRDRGKRYDSASYALRVLDRIFTRFQIQHPSQIQTPVVEAYLLENAPAPRTGNKRLMQLRLFFRFLRRRGLELPDPAQSWPPLHEPPFRPHLFTLQEVGRILAELERRRKASGHPGSWKALEVIYFLLYACGLRLSEPLKLRNQDVDLDQRALFIACTKFYKQRWVPLGQGATRRLKEYAELRQQLFPESTRDQDPFFLNSRGRAFTKGWPQQLFRQARQALGLVCRGTNASPRIHDLRHSFAISRLYKWYSEGADVQNKLPLLATYMGHLNYHSTEVYLHLAEDLLRQGGRLFEASFTRIVQASLPDETS